jgi:hypothetical protein
MGTGISSRNPNVRRRARRFERVLAVVGVLAALVPSVVILSAGPAAATAQTFTVTMSGLQEVPANASSATGTASVDLNAAETTITVNASWTGLTTNANAGHIHGPAGPGVNAGIIFPFAGVPAATSGSIPSQPFAITAAQVADLKAGLYYVNIHNATFPNGEIRAQLTPTRLYTVTLSGAQEVPPNGSPATGTGSVELNGAETLIAARLSWSGLTGNATAAHIHGPAGPGVNAAILFGFTGVPAATTGSIPTQVFAITPAQVADLKAGQFYFNVHSIAFEGGEIRGQIVDTVAPACSYTIVAGNPKRIDFTVVDAGSGLNSITVTTAVNVTVPLPAFTPGTTAPVAFSAIKQNQAQSAQVAVILIDPAGNLSSCV